MVFAIKKLADNEVGTIITGFCYISQQGKSMHPQQCGIDDDDKIAYWKKIVGVAKEDSSVTLIMQIAHAGRQTLSSMTGLSIISPSSKRSSYFKEKPIAMNEEMIHQVIEEFGDAARRAKKAGFDGVQVHAAHGYLIHQFISPLINCRRDKWGKKSIFISFGGS